MSIRRENSYWLNHGTVLADRYRIERVIEEGGFGIIYLGWDELLQMKVSVKEYFPRELAEREKNVENISVYRGKTEQIFEKGLEKFLNEARILASVNRLEGIVWVQDFFYANNTAYIIMQYIDGINIREYIQKYGIMDFEQVLKIMNPILQSLGQVHELGLIHRDISPDNIVISKEEIAYLVDFGIARPYAESDLKTITVFFKRGYAAEEQYREKGEQGPWTDIYSVCATMYYMLTGVQPVESVQRNIKDTLMPLSAYRNIKVPRYIEKAIRKGMSVEATNRYATARQLYNALYEDKNSLSKSNRKKLFYVMIGFGGCFLTLFLYFGKHFGEKAILSENLKQKQPVAMETEKVINTPVPSDDSVLLEKETFKSKKVYTIPNMQGKTEKKAKKLFQKIGDNSIKLTVKKIYHAKIAKGKVIKQSIRAGFQYKKGDIGEIILTVSKGKKESKPQSTYQNIIPTKEPEVTRKPIVTRKPAVTPIPEKPSQKDDDFVGTLPY